MKINTVYYGRNERRKECHEDQPIRKYSKNPEDHPFLLEREYVRALNATKLDRMFAKPFIGALTHMGEGISHLVKDYEEPFFATASYDMKVNLWDMVSRKVVSTKNYSMPVSGIALDNKRNIFVGQGSSVVNNIGVEYKCGHHVNSLDFLHGGTDDLVVGTNDDVQIFDIERLTPKLRYDTIDTISVRCNRSFQHIIAVTNSTAIDLYDNRIGKLFATIKQPGINCMDFNPQSGYIMACGSEDGNGYAYDLRNTENSIGTYRGHVNAVVSVCFRPNGHEIATGSFDKTIRIFDINSRKSRDCYYNARMQIVHAVSYSNDGQYIISGSDDGCLRLWKADASVKIGPLSKYEKEAFTYRAALKEKYKNIGEISRISKHRFIPKDLKELSKQKHDMYEAHLRREAKKNKDY